MRLHQFLKDTFRLCKSEVQEFNISHNVKVNGIPNKWLSYIIKPLDIIEVDGKVYEIKEEDNVYLLFNKPIGITCTNDRNTPSNIRNFVNYDKRIFPIGRLDKDSCGIIILTNDGKIFNKILDSNNHIEKEYLLKVDHPINDIFLNLMSKGVPILGKVTKPCKMEYVSECEFKITLKEGMNRQIRRMCKFFGYRVISLQRIRIGNLFINNLKEGTYRLISQKEIEDLLLFNGKSV